MFDYNTIELDRQKKLFEAGVTSRDALDQAQQAYDNSKADYEAALQTRNMQEEQLAGTTPSARRLTVWLAIFPFRWATMFPR